MKNYIDVFITHAWRYHEDWLNVCEIIDNYKEYIESVELRLTSRGNIIQKNDGLGYTEWIDIGISIGYEF